jgi:DNA-binding FadR family transcriptional regulator
VLRVSEVRRTLECETAALASQRRTEADIKKIKTCLKKLDEAVEKGEDAIEEDIDLHMSIAQATHNEYFPRLLASFSSVLIARRRVRSDLREPEKLKAYLHIVQGQHHEIVEAIIAGDAETASAVMRTHLDGSRYRNLLIKEKSL